MIQIRKRWPILTAAATAAFYGVNNYHISGLDSLRIVPRSTSVSSPMAKNTDWSSPNLSDLSTDVFGFSGMPGYDANRTSLNPPWGNRLNAGEKLAVITNSNLSSGAPFGSALNASQIVSTSPVVQPIPTPPSMFNERPVAGISGSGTSFVATAAEQLPSIPGSVFSAGDVNSGQMNNINAVRGGNGRIKIASFNLDALGPTKLSRQSVIEAYVSILSQFDVVALQEIQSDRDDIIPILLERLNQSGRKYDYAIGPRVGRSMPHQQFAFLFDTATVETDRYQLYTVDDPEDLMTFEPLVGWFRCKGVSTDKAFTFSLVNVRIDPNDVAKELALLPNLIQAIESDGRNEDDWIILGDFGAGNAEISSFDRNAVRFAIQDVPTTVTGDHMSDSIVFGVRGTTEFTGKSGVYDFLRKNNLSFERAMEISDHLPVWAEFFTAEGAELGRVAPPRTSDVL